MNTSAGRKVISRRRHSRFNRVWGGSHFRPSLSPIRSVCVRLQKNSRDHHSLGGRRRCCFDRDRLTMDFKELGE
jgi:hypothetical protein